MLETKTLSGAASGMISRQNPAPLLRPMPPSRSLAYLCLALSMALVGGYVALSKPLAAVLPVFLLAWLRFGIGAVAMAHWLQKPAAEPPLDGRTHGLLFLTSFLGNFLFTVSMVTGVSLTSAVTAGVVMSAIPAAIAVMSWLFLHERVPARIWWAVVCAVVGIALFSLSKQEHSALSAYTLQTKNTQNTGWLGEWLLLAAVTCEAAYSVIGKKLTATLGPRRISALINLWGFALSTPLGLYHAWGFDFTAVGLGHWLLLVFYALAACQWTVWLWMTGLKAVPAAQGGVFSVFLPISAALVGVLALGETLGGMQWLAFGIALASVLLATLPSRLAWRVRSMQ